MLYWYRLNPVIEGKNIDLDDFSTEAIERMKRAVD